jgi:hypothetical protein
VLCSELAPQSLALVEAFGLPDELLRSPIGKITKRGLPIDFFGDAIKFVHV